MNTSNEIKRKTVDLLIDVKESYNNIYWNNHIENFFYALQFILSSKIEEQDIKVNASYLLQSIKQKVYETINENFSETELEKSFDIFSNECKENVDKYFMNCLKFCQKDFLLPMQKRLLELLEEKYEN